MGVVLMLRGQMPVIKSSIFFLGSGVLQLDQCGSCFLDYILRSTLAQSPNYQPTLTSLSLRGLCQPSDVGLSTLLSSVPALQSINLSQCSLLTSSSTFSHPQVFIL